jgi:hypothetical protein
MMIRHHLPRLFELIELLLSLDDFLPKLFDDAHEALQSGYYFFEG